MTTWSISLVIQSSNINFKKQDIDPPYEWRPSIVLFLLQYFAACQLSVWHNGLNQDKPQLPTSIWYIITVYIRFANLSECYGLFLATSRKH